MLILTVITGAAYNLFGKKTSETYTPVEMSFAMTLAGGVVFNVQNLLEGNGFHAYEVLLQGGKTAWALVFLGLGCGFVAYFIYNLEISNLPATATACIATNAINVVGVVAGILISGDSWGIYTVIGVILTVVGITMTAAGGTDTDAVPTDT